jgi:hypothetical protein
MIGITQTAFNSTSLRTFAIFCRRLALLRRLSLTVALLKMKRRSSSAVIFALNKKLLHRIQSNAQAGFLSIRRGFMDRTRLGGLIERGRDVSQRRGCLVFFAAAKRGEVLLLQRVETRFDAAVVKTFARAVTHATFG